MTSEGKYLSFDLGAESGRALLGMFNGNSLEMQEIHRFPNGAVNIRGHLYWDVLHVFAEIKQALTKAHVATHGQVRSVGISTWGIDFALLDRNGELVAQPYCYRDPHTNGMMEYVFSVIPKEEVFRQTGVQFMPINAIYHLAAISRNSPERLENAEVFLQMPDLFGFWLTGIGRSEATIASTSQLFNGREGKWATDVISRLGLPLRIFGRTCAPGTILGTLTKEVTDETGIREVPVISVAGHDTASAVAATPLLEPDVAYISSGTWSAVGVELAAPCLSQAALDANFTNEVGVGGTFMFRKNMMGLWILQECRRVWQAAGHSLSYEELTSMAVESSKCESIIEPDSATFLQPGDMPQRIRDFCVETEQSPPDDYGSIARTVLVSLALKYRFLVDQIDTILDRETQIVHLVGGGCRNHLLCQLTADALSRPVISGPAEATASGNLILQMVADGSLDSHTQGRQLISRSYQPVEYRPEDTGLWNDRFSKFLEMRKKTSTAF